MKTRRATVAIAAAVTGTAALAGLGQAQVPPERVTAFPMPGSPVARAETSSVYRPAVAAAGLATKAQTLSDNPSFKTARNAGIHSCGVTYGFQPETLATHPPDVLIDQALRLKASGYLMKAEPIGVLLDAIRAVAQGEVRFSREIEELTQFARSSLRTARG